MKKHLHKLYGFLIFAFLYAPILVMVVYSFNGIKSRSVFEGFSLQWYQALFDDRLILESFYNSLVVAALSALIATVIGTFAAVGINKMKNRPKQAFLFVNNIPVVNPDIVTAISMMILFVFFLSVTRAMEMGFWTLLIAHVTFNIPYVVLNVLPKLRGMDNNIYDAALDLGCTPIKAFLKVVLPQIMPGIITGVIMSFTLSLDDFIISYFNSGTSFQTLPITIYSMTKKPYSPKINALSTLLFVFVLILMLIVNLRQSQNEKSKNKGGKVQATSPVVKRVIAVALSAVIVVSCAFVLVRLNSTSEIVLNVYNWGEYIDLSVIDRFEEEYGITVNYTTFDQNESMYTKVISGSADYDIVIPSDYMISKMIEEDLLAELDFDNIPNYAYIDDAYKNLEFDPENKYSVPYTWGTTVIMYNDKYVDPEDVADKSINLLWNEKYAGNILMFDNPRDVFGLALKKSGYSMNSLNPDEWAQAAADLQAQKPIISAYVMDQIFDKMISEEAYIAPYYAGDWLIIAEENEHVKCYIPAEGANMFVDSMCVLKSSKNKEAAELFINFMCETEIAVLNAEAIGYATPHSGAMAELDPEITGNEIVYPDKEVLSKTEVFVNLPQDVLTQQSNYWIDLKIESSEE